MNELWTALAVGIAGPLGAVVILIVFVALAAGLAERIYPAPRPPAEEEAREAVERPPLQEQLDEQVPKGEGPRGRESVDSTHVSFPAFAITCGVGLVLTSWTAALEHLNDPGTGFPLMLALRPLWSSLIAALAVGTASGFLYRRWFRHQSRERREAIRTRLRDRQHRAFRLRLQPPRRPGNERMLQ
ncbi:hypothetical protein GCM10009853_072790 [Glycomyces scopariae]|uniref:Uncharacterized protein n=1 Tax=Glycomyces sambucus TaxID=380244 RepID=A0A1G9CFX2_9ACTN|nr:hypothetical protein [Glycomyces sambucus]SDK50548.1 hypothetical protein SAMN05216298_0314 [Glycomyces sambucus]